MGDTYMHVYVCMPIPSATKKKDNRSNGPKAIRREERNIKSPPYSITSKA